METTLRRQLQDDRRIRNCRNRQEDLYKRIQNKQLNSVDQPSHFNVAKSQRDQQHLDLLRCRRESQKHGENIIDTLAEIDLV